MEPSEGAAFEEPSLRSAITKALAPPTAAVALDKRRVIEKAVGTSPTLRGAVASAFARSGFAVERGFDGPTHEQRIAKARTHLKKSYAPGSREAIEAKARELGTRI
jgi:hypothetical protein